MLLSEKAKRFDNIDCHIHSRFSPDAKRMGADDPFKIAATVRERGLRGFAITDHIDVGHWLDSPPFDFPKYFDTWNEVREKNKDLFILIGVEVGYEQDRAEETARLLDGKPFEYVINSVHYWREPVKSATGYSNYYLHGKHGGYSDYLRAISASLDAPYRFDAIGHLGFPERYAPFPPDERKMDYSEFGELFDEIIEKAVAKNILFEENTSGGGPELFQPRAEFLRAYKAAGGVRPVLGSDAHVSSAIAQRFDKATVFLDGIFDN